MKLDYDGKKFELYVPFNRRNWSILVKRIGKCNKRPSKGCYSVPDNYWTLLEIYKHYEDIKPTDAAQERLNHYTEKVSKLENLLPKLRTIKEVDASLVPVDFDFKGKYDLYDHQIKMWWAAKEFLKLNCGFLFLADPGTGKSAPAVNVVEYLLENGVINNCLVVTPASLKLNFGEQFDIHSNTSYNVLVDYNKDQRKGKSGRRWRWTKPEIPLEDYYNGCTDFLDNETNAPVQIVNYKCIAKETKKFKDYDMIIGDEFHYVRKRTSNRSKAFKKLAQHIPKRLGMTATPLARDYLDLFSQIDIIDPDLIHNRFDQFREEIAHTFQVDYQGNGHKVTEVSSWKEDGEKWLHEQLYSRAIKYDIEDVTELEEPIRKTVDIEMPTRLKKFYEELVGNMVIEFGEMGDEDYQYLDATNSLVVVTYARQLSAGFITVDDEPILISDFKIKALKEQLEKIGNKQVIIWYKHKVILAEIKKMLAECGSTFGIINGDTTSMEKGRFNNQFNKGELDYLVASVDVTEGFNAQESCHYAIFIENNYTWDKREQAEGRIYREGQTKTCVYIDLVALESLDRRILQGIRKGESLSNRLLYGEMFKLEEEK